MTPGVLATDLFLYTMLAAAWLALAYWAWIVYDSVRLHSRLDALISAVFVVTLGALLALYYLGSEQTSLAFRIFILILILLPVIKNVAKRRQAKRLLRGL